MQKSKHWSMFLHLNTKQVKYLPSVYPRQFPRGKISECLTNDQQVHREGNQYKFYNRKPFSNLQGYIDSDPLI